MKKILVTTGVALLLFGCAKKQTAFDASGVFEADEVIVSAEATGKLLQLGIEEGDELKKGEVAGLIDTEALLLQRAQVAASLAALSQKQNDAAPQVAVIGEQLKNQQQNILTLKTQLAVAEKEQKRVENLVKNEATPAKQLDDVNGQVAVLRQQIAAAESLLNTLRQQSKSQKQSVDIQNRGILSEAKPLEQRLAQIDDQIERCTIVNPIDGTVLTRYLVENEMAAVGKPIYKIAHTKALVLRAYVSGSQLNQVKVGQPVKVFTGNGDTLKETAGTVTWISPKAEFTPKTIQTADERANLVYAMKISVPNDGFLKIGMYGDVLF